MVFKYNPQSMEYLFGTKWMIIPEHGEKKIMAKPTREELIKLCEDGVVPVDEWSNRDSAAAQNQLGKAWAMLKAGVEYHIEDDVKHGAWWVEFTYPGFSAFEEGRDKADGYWDEDTRYIPTRERLEQAAGGDWY